MTIELILAAFGGGIFGTLLGGTAAFILVGITGLAGVAVVVATGSATILETISFGPFLGPHVAFAGAVAAAAYAGKKKHLVTGADCNTPLGFTQDPMVLLVGGGFGVLGLFINDFYVSNFHVILPIDSVAFSVATTGILSRLLFGKSGLIGNKELADQDTLGRYHIPTNSLIFGFLTAIALGAITSVAALKLQVVEIGFVISATSLIFLYTTPGGGPVTHHLTITAGLATVQTGNVYYGVIASLISFVLFEYLGVRTFNKYNDTHIDAPAVAITITSLIILNLFPKI